MSIPLQMDSTAWQSTASSAVREAISWFCTDSGLSRFDGYRFATYLTEHGLPHDMVFDFVEDREGRRWVATHHGLVEFHPIGKQRFTVRTIASRKNRSIRRLLLDRSGQLWVGTYEGLFRSQGDGFAAVDFGAPDEYAGSHVTSLLEDRLGSLWIGARSGLYRRWPDGCVEHYTTNDGLPHKNVEVLLEETDGRLWAGTRGFPNI